MIPRNQNRPAECSATVKSLANWKAQLPSGPAIVPCVQSRSGNFPIRLRNTVGFRRISSPSGCYSHRVRRMVMIELAIVVELSCVRHEKKPPLEVAPLALMFNRPRGNRQRPEERLAALRRHRPAEKCPQPCTVIPLTPPAPKLNLPACWWLLSWMIPHRPLSTIIPPESVLVPSSKVRSARVRAADGIEFCPVASRPILVPAEKTSSLTPHAPAWSSQARCAPEWIDPQFHRCEEAGSPLPSPSHSHPIQRRPPARGVQHPPTRPRRSRKRSDAARPFIGPGRCRWNKRILALS